jgi:potassium-transporting ATPase KdpC subunit
VLRTFSTSLLLLIFLVTICCLIYPASLWVIGHVLFPFEANGSIIVDSDGRRVGSKLIAQPFTHTAYFHPRPSAASYDAAASRSSSLAPSNQALRDRVAHSLNQLDHTTLRIPADMVMTSASGLDPHITLDNARYQLDRVASWWASHHRREMQQLHAEIGQLLENKAIAPLGGLAGEKFVNVLEINLELRKLFGDPNSTLSK